MDEQDRQLVDARRFTLAATGPELGWARAVGRAEVLPARLADQRDNAVETHDHGAIRRRTGDDVGASDVGIEELVPAKRDQLLEAEQPHAEHAGGATLARM